MRQKCYTVDIFVLIVQKEVYHAVKWIKYLEYLISTYKSL